MSDRVSPFGWIDERSHGRLLVILTALLLLLSIALGAIGGSLATPEAPSGIVSFEFASSADGAARILDSWSPEAREDAMLSLGLDYLYLFVYPAWLSLACLLIARRLGPWQERLGVDLAWVVLAAGALDALENYALIQILTVEPSDAWARLALFCAAPKFALVFLATLYVLVGGGGLLWRRWRTA